MGSNEGHLGWIFKQIKIFDQNILNLDYGQLHRKIHKSAQVLNKPQNRYVLDTDDTMSIWTEMTFDWFSNSKMQLHCTWSNVWNLNTNFYLESK